MPEISKLVSPSYLFDPYPSSEFNYYWIVIIFFILIFAMSIIMSKKIQKDQILKKICKKSPFRLKVFSISGLILLAFRYQEIPFLSMRILLIALIIGFIVHMIITIYRKQKLYPILMEEKKHKQKEKKYIPQKKKKSKKKKK